MSEAEPKQAVNILPLSNFDQWGCNSEECPGYKKHESQTMTKTFAGYAMIVEREPPNKPHYMHKAGLMPSMWCQHSMECDILLDMSFYNFGPLTKQNFTVKQFEAIFYKCWPLDGPSSAQHADIPMTATRALHFAVLNMGFLLMPPIHTINVSQRSMFDWLFGCFFLFFFIYLPLGVEGSGRQSDGLGTAVG